MLDVCKLILLAGTLVIVSCGGSAREAPGAPEAAATSMTQSPEITRESYISKADAYCKTANAETKKLNRRAKRAAASQASNERILAALAPIYKEDLRGPAATNRRICGYRSTAGRP